MSNIAPISEGGEYWYWSFGDGQTSTEKHPSMTYETSNYYTVQLIAENYLGCKDTTFRNIYIKPELQGLCGEDALDLLSKMLVYDHAERITPKDALEHRYFDPIRKGYN